MTPTIELLPHNQELYRKVAEQIDKGEKSIFYSEATGLGKSYVFMKLASEYFAGKRILYIVPKIAIWENMLHYKEFNELPAKIEMSTFAAFNTYDKNERLYENYDMVFVDECHHMLSDIQGVNVSLFLDDMVNNGRYAIGCTATPKHDDVYVDEKFFNVSCYGYDVFEAVELGILPKVDIAVANTDISTIPDDVRVRYSVSSTKSIIEQIIEERSDITHWLAYFGRKADLEDSEQDIMRLFPDFTILKLYHDVGNPKDVIDMFENFEGKVILLSVSMMLEGMHLNTVGGVLLYRNVTRIHTYFQIYGRLCKINAKTSPLLVDMTNSVYNIDDFSTFKSSRATLSKRSYNRRDLFDVESTSYRYVQLSEEMNPVKVKRYRDVVWTTNVSLSRALGKKKYAVSSYLANHVECSACDYIDYVLKDLDYSQYVANGYSQYREVEIAGKVYRYSNPKDLGRKVGRDVCITCFDIDKFVKLVEWEYDHGFIIRGIYRGADITSINTLSKFVGVAHNTLKVVIEHDKISASECVDLFLDKDKWYNGICLLNGIDEVQRQTGINRTEIMNKYKELSSIKELIDYYLSDLNIYAGIDLRKTTISKVANKLGVDRSMLGLYMHNNNCGFRECIDYFGCTDEEQKIIDANKDSINPIRVLKLMIPGKDDLWYKAHVHFSAYSNIGHNFSNEEMNKILELAERNTSWEDITRIINNMECNRWAGIKLNRQQIVRAYNLYTKKHGTGTKIEYAVDGSTKRRRYKFTQEELDKIDECKRKGLTWGQTTVAVNSIESNVESGIRRSSSSVINAYNRYRATSNVN